MEGTRGPLVLGSGGRVGRLLRRLDADGRWPGPRPLWHARRPDPGVLGWDLRDGPPPGADLGAARGLVVLAGAVSAGEAALAANEEAALAALRLARERGLGPVLLMSSAAVYGRAGAPGGEGDAPVPATPYGASKLRMEEAARADADRHGGPALACLRVANVAGADMLFGAMAAGPVTLDRFADGSSPRRAYVGPLALARVLAALAARGDLPRVLNVAQPGTVGMADLLRAAGVPWAWREAPATALPALALDTGRAEALAPLPPATPEGLVAEARLAGWRAAGEAGGEAGGEAP